jgi:hypothetical protein
MEAIHLEDRKFQNDEVKFIRYVVYRIQSFQGIITGWYLANSDLVVLDEVCKCIGVGSPVEFYEVPVFPSDEDSAVGDDSNSLSNNIKDVRIISYP